MHQGKYLDWLIGYGGPLLILPANLLSQWHGISRVFGTGTAPSDFDRACAASRHDLLNPIDVDSGQGLVLGDAHDLLATWWPLRNASTGKEAILVRFLYAENEDVVDRALHNLPPGIWELLDFTLEVRADTLYLFAAESGGNWMEESLSIKVTPGTYKVEEAIYEIKAQVGLMLHRLTLMT